MFRLGWAPCDFTVGDDGVALMLLFAIPVILFIMWDNNASSKNKLLKQNHQHFKILVDIRFI